MEFFGKKLTQKQVETLVLKGKTGALNGFKNEDGSTFSGVLRLDDNFRVIVDKK
jgi:DNA topoisomerase-3